MTGACYRGKTVNFQFRGKRAEMDGMIQGTGHISLPLGNMELKPGVSGIIYNSNTFFSFLGGWTEHTKDQAESDGKKPSLSHSFSALLTSTPPTSTISRPPDKHPVWLRFGCIWRAQCRKELPEYKAGFRANEKLHRPVDALYLHVILQ